MRDGGPTGSHIVLSGAFGRSHGKTFGKERAGQVELARAFGRRNQCLRNEIPLGVAAADAYRVITHGLEEFDRAGIGACGESEYAVDQATANVGGDGVVVPPAVARVTIKGAAQAFDAQLVARPRDSERNMQIVEYKHMVVDMGQPLVGERAPTVSHVGPCELQSPEQSR